MALALRRCVWAIPSNLQLGKKHSFKWIKLLKKKWYWVMIYIPELGQGLVRHCCKGCHYRGLPYCYLLFMCFVCVVWSNNNKRRWKIKDGVDFDYVWMCEFISFRFLKWWPQLHAFSSTWQNIRLHLLNAWLMA